MVKSNENGDAAYGNYMETVLWVGNIEDFLESKEGLELKVVISFAEFLRSQCKYQNPKAN